MQAPEAALDARRGAPRPPTTSPPGSAAPAVVLPPADRGFAPGRSQRKIERTVGLELEMPLDEMARVAEQVTDGHEPPRRLRAHLLGLDRRGRRGRRLRAADPVEPAAARAARPRGTRGRAHPEPERPRRDARARDRDGPAPGGARRAPQPAAPARGRDHRRGGRGASGAGSTWWPARSTASGGSCASLRLRTDYAVVTVSLLPQDGDSEGGGAGGSFDDALGDAGDLLVGVAGIAGPRDRGGAAARADRTDGVAGNPHIPPPPARIRAGVGARR